MRGVFTVAKIAVSCAYYGFDSEYSYSVPENLTPYINDGVRVVVPFGKGNKKTIGFVIRTYEAAEYNGALKPVESVVDEKSLVTPEMMKIILWLKENTFCTYFDAYKTVVPTGFSYRIDLHYNLVNTYIDETELSDEERGIIAFMRNSSSQREIDKYLSLTGNTKRKKALESLIDRGYIELSDTLKRRVGDDNIKMIELSSDYLDGNTNATLTPKQSLIVKLLEEVGCASEKEIRYMTNCTGDIIKRLEGKNVLRSFKSEHFRNVFGEAEKSLMPELVELSEQQQCVYDGISKLIDSNTPCGALLYGVTGSGKTLVYIKLIDKVLKSGKTAILLVPEISLTPQLLSRFRSYFGETIAVLHSSLSLGQRTDEFKRILSGSARIVIGTRSAVFAPLRNIGVIILDEEGEQTYKSDSSPRYHARDVAIQRCGHNNCTLLLASATPSLECFYYAKTKRFHLFEMKSRYKDSELPHVKIVDMQKEAASGNDGLLSSELIHAIKDRLSKGEQTILLLNRRGFTTTVSCLSCSTAISCPNCSIPLTYHKKNDHLMCHYCGYTMKFDGHCPQCHGDKLKMSGVGTQRVEDEVIRLFPDARVLRMDADTTSSRYSYEENFTAFEKGEYDIMLGTQMIAKGLDFPNVTLVGVVSLDRSLFTGDYKSYERTFSLLTQVAGRSGRGDKPGEAYIQTFVPDHYVLELASKQDYEGFYEQEIALRQALMYPPFCDMCVIGLSSQMESSCIAASEWVTNTLSRYIKSNKISFPLRAIGPAPCAIEMINNRYRYRLILKTRNCKEFRGMIKDMLYKFYKNKDLSNVRIFADINGDIGL